MGGAIVISSSISADAITGVAGRAICCGGGGISISGGSSIASISSDSKEKSAAVSSGQKANAEKWTTVAAIIDPQNQELKLRFRRSLAVSLTSKAVTASSALIVSPSACFALTVLQKPHEQHRRSPALSVAGPYSGMALPDRHERRSLVLFQMRRTVVRLQ